MGSVFASESGSGVFDTFVPQVPSVLPRAPPPPPPPPRPVPPAPAAEATVAIDWGGLIGGVAESYIGARYAPQPTFQPQSFVAAPVPQPSPGLVIDSAGIRTGGGAGSVAMNSNELCGTPATCGTPRYLTYDCKTGEFKVRRRRRRRRLLTNQDIADLNSIVAMAGKGAALQAAIAQATRR